MHACWHPGCAKWCRRCQSSTLSCKGDLGVRLCSQLQIKASFRAALNSSSAALQLLALVKLTCVLPDRRLKYVPPRHWQLARLDSSAIECMKVQLASLLLPEPVRPQSGLLHNLCAGSLCEQCFQAQQLCDCCRHQYTLLVVASPIVPYPVARSKMITDEVSIQHFVRT